MENIEALITMYKADKITPYVVERELSNYMGNRCVVQIIEQTNHDVNKSFCFFALPELKVEGLVLTFIVDKAAILSLYNADEVAVICERLRNNIQKILSKYNDFLNNHAAQDISKYDILGFILGLYSLYAGEFNVGGKNASPDIDEVLKASDKFITGQAIPEDIERLQISDIICKEVLDYCERQARVASEKVTIKVVDKVEREIPAFCIGKQEIRKYCAPDSREKLERVIPYNYLPKTNQ